MLAYRIFFPLAALEAIFVVGMWPIALLAGESAPIDMSLLAEWHADELLFGYVPAVLAGFVITALPRWMAAPLAPSPPIRLLAALWITGRVCALMALATGIKGTSWIGPLFPVVLALLAGRYIAAARNWRNAKVAVLLGVIALGAVVEAAGSSGSTADHPGQRIAIAAALGLVMVFGGRITPSLTAALLATHGGGAPSAGRGRIEVPAALLAMAALASWVAIPDAPETAMLCAGAAVAQSLRQTQWPGLSVIANPNVFVFHAAYACVPLGFALIALGSSPLAMTSAAAAIHAWTMGAIGLMSLAVMTSMVRRQTGRPFESSPLANAAYALAIAAAVCRVASEVSGPAAKVLLLVSAASWLAAFGLFLMFLHSRLRIARRLTSAPAASCGRAMGAENCPCDCGEA